MISVIVASYNGAPYILQQLYSIKEQTIVPDQVIIADDGSQDNTVALVKGFIKEHSLDPKWRVVEREKNLGLRRNFLNAMLMAEGEYIFLADQDDVWFNDKIRVMCQAMESNKDIQILACRYDLIGADGKRYDGKKKVPHVYFLAEEKIEYVDRLQFIISSFIRGCAMCVRGELIPHIEEGFDTGSLLGHDWYLCLLASVYGRVAFLNQKLMSYRIHDNNASIPNHPLHLDNNRKEVVQKMKEAAAYTRKLVAGDIEAEGRAMEFETFFESRIELFHKAGLEKILGLLGKMKYYKIYRRSGRGAFETYLADVIYAVKK